jgi:hypothetical protein
MLDGRNSPSSSWIARWSAGKGPVRGFQKWYVTAVHRDAERADKPYVVLRDPKLRPRDGGTFEEIPHLMFYSKEPELSGLCLFDPNGNEWSNKLLIADTAIVWAAECGRRTATQGPMAAKGNRWQSSTARGAKGSARRFGTAGFDPEPARDQSRDCPSARRCTGDRPVTGARSAESDRGRSTGAATSVSCGVPLAGPSRRRASTAAMGRAGG